MNLDSDRIVQICRIALSHLQLEPCELSSVLDTFRQLLDNADVQDLVIMTDHIDMPDSQILLDEQLPDGTLQVDTKRDFTISDIDTLERAGAPEWLIDQARDLINKPAA